MLRQKWVRACESNGDMPVHLAQWNHCLRICCNKNVSGWIAGLNPFCQLIEIRALGCPGILAAGSYFPFNGHQYTKHWLFAAISQKKGSVPRNFHANDKYGATPVRFKPLHSHEGCHRELQPDTSRTHWRSSGLGGCLWLVLACLGLSCVLPCFGRPKQKQTLGTLFFSPSPRLLCSLIRAKMMNFQALPWWNIWPIALFGWWWWWSDSTEPGWLRPRSSVDPN